jgi:hypothetical protein
MEKHRSVSISYLLLSFSPMTIHLDADPYPFARDEAFDTYRLMVESCKCKLIELRSNGY